MLNKAAVCLGQTGYDIICMSEWRQFGFVIDVNVAALSCRAVKLSVHWEDAEDVQKAQCVLSLLLLQIQSL